MDQRLSLITIGVPDLAAARSFYLEGLGWTPVLDIPEAVLFLQVGPGLLLSLFDADELAKDIGPQYSAAPTVGNVRSRTTSAPLRRWTRCWTTRSTPGRSS